MIIYKTTNLINGKIYVGFKKHFNSESDLLLSEYYGSGTIIRRVINKYGKENFKREVLEICENEKHMIEREIFWIKELNSQNKEIGYNISPGGHGGDSFTNNPNKEEIRQKCREKSLGENNPMYKKWIVDIWIQKYGIEEAINLYSIWCEKISKNSSSRKGFKHSKETKDKMKIKALSRENKTNYFPDTKGENNGMFGKKHSEETKEKIRLKAKNKNITDKTREKLSLRMKERWEKYREEKNLINK